MLYDFICDKCKTVAEISCGMGDIQNIIPPECNDCRGPMKRVFNPVSIAWKCGGGNNSYGQTNQNL